jgi:hypothetical protein
VGGVGCGGGGWGWGWGCFIHVCALSVAVLRVTDGFRYLGALFIFLFFSYAVLSFTASPEQVKFLSLCVS